MPKLLLIQSRTTSGRRDFRLLTPPTGYVGSKPGIRRCRARSHARRRLRGSAPPRPARAGRARIPGHPVRLHRLAARAARQRRRTGHHPRPGPGARTRRRRCGDRRAQPPAARPARRGPAAQALAVGNGLARRAQGPYALRRVTVRRSTSTADFERLVDGRSLTRVLARDRALTEGYAMHPAGRTAGPPPPRLNTPGHPYRGGGLAGPRGGRRTRGRDAGRAVRPAPGHLPDGAPGTARRRGRGPVPVGASMDA